MGGIPNKVFRPRRDFKGMERRRARAAQLFRAGKKQAEVARSLRVSRQSVSRWFLSFLEGGAKKLKGAGRAGRKPRLDARQLAKVDAALRLGAKCHGFKTNLWTLPRIAKVIEQLTGAKYHPGHVWRILHRLDWSLQRPAKRARERNEEAVKQWVSKRWAVIKKKRENSTAGSSFKMKAASLSGPPSAVPGRPKAKRRS